MPTKETVIRNEIVRVNGKVKAITVPKEKTQEILERRTLRLLDKKYEVLMPSVDDMEKNTIDLQGMMTFIQGYLSLLFSGSGKTYVPVLNIEIDITTTSGSTVRLLIGSGVSFNAQGVTTAMQIFGQQNSMQVQYYFIGYDTTNSSYQGSFVELYAVSYANLIGGPVAFSNSARIAYANLSINKQSNYDLFILWMIEFKNVPSYLIVFIPVIPSSPGLVVSAGSPSAFTVYVNNGNCNFTCGGNCPSSSPSNFMISIQNNTIIVQIPILISINNGTSSAQVLMCESAQYTQFSFNARPGNFNDERQITLGKTVSFNSSYSTTIIPPSSGYTVFVLLAVVVITFTVA